jgi:hypothetical protein
VGRGVEGVEGAATGAIIFGGSAGERGFLVLFGGENGRGRIWMVAIG